MKLHKHAITEELSLKLRYELTKIMGSVEPKWMISQYRWLKYEPDGKFGTLLTAEISEDLKKELEPTIKGFFPEYEDIDMFYVLSQPGTTLKNLRLGDLSFISATLFLNENWDLRQGGHIIWRKEDKSQFEGLIPTLNALAVSEPDDEFIFTSVSTSSPQPRFTIQIHVTPVLNVIEEE